MTAGTEKGFNPAEAFIKPDNDGKDVFVPILAKASHSSLNEGAKVSYEEAA